MSEDRRKQIWFDGTHFTWAGYDLLGSLLFEKYLRAFFDFLIRRRDELVLTLLTKSFAYGGHPTETL
jgi:hypothetical protein